MPTYGTPGVYYERLDAAPGITSVRTDVAGFVGIAEHGIRKPRGNLDGDSWEPQLTERPTRENDDQRTAKGGSMAECSREEVYAAWKRRMELQDADDWDGFGRTFTENAVYHEHHYGVFRGRKAILEWLVPVMQYCKGWTYPVVWVAIDGSRVVHKWMNRLPGKREDGSFFEFAGMTAMEYAGNGQFSFQEDIYNRIETDKIIDEWKAATGGQYR